MSIGILMKSRSDDQLVMYLNRQLAENKGTKGSNGGVHPNYSAGNLLRSTQTKAMSTKD